MHQLQRNQWFARPLAEVFAFFSDVRHLNQITPPWLHFCILTPEPIVMRAGTILDFRLRLHGVPIRWRSAITVWEPNRQFVDEQRRGPYRFWRHRHRFEERDGGTWMEDLVDYELPGGICAPLLHRWLVRPDLEAIFDFRRHAMRAYFA